MKFSRNFFILLILMTVSIGCSDDDNNAVIPLDSASIRVLHASPDAPNVDVLVDNKVVLSDVSYKQASDFLSVFVGTRNVKVNAAGTSTTVINADLTLAFDSFTTIIATNVLDEIEPLVLKDKITPPSGNLLNIRVVHSAPSAPAVDVYVTAPGADINTATPTLSNVAFTEFSDFLEIPEGDYQIRVTTVGSKDPVFDSGTVTLDAGSIFSAVAVDATSGESPISLVVLTNDPTTPFFEIDDKSASLRVLHGSPNAPNVDVLIDDEVVLEDVPYKTASKFLSVASGSRNIKVNAAGTSTTVINADLDAALNSFTTIIAADFSEQIVPLVLPDENTPPADPVSLKVRVVHGAPSAPPVDVYVTAPGADINAATPTLSNVAFTEFSPFLEIPEGDYQIRVTTVGSKDSVFDSGTVTLDAGSIFTAVAVDATSGESPISLVVLTNDPTTPFFEIDDKSASLRVLHGSPDAPNVDVLIDDEVVLEDVPYKTASKFLSVASGSRNIKVNVAGTSTTVITADLDAALNSFTTIIAADFSLQIVPLVLPDENTPPTDPGSLKVRVVHGSPSAPTVDVYVTAPNADINTETPTLPNVPFQGFSDYTEIPEGDYRIRLTGAGSKIPVYDSGTVPLDAGSILTVVAVDDAIGGGLPVSLVVLTNDPATPFIEIPDNL